MSRVLSLAGFQVTLIGRFWVTPEAVRASRVEVSEDCLSFFKADGTLAAFFDKSAVRSWREMNESELLAN